MKITRTAHRSKMILRRAKQRAREGTTRSAYSSPSHARNSLTGAQLREIRAEHGVGRPLHA